MKRLLYLFVALLFITIVASPAVASSLSLQTDEAKVTIGNEQSIAIILDTDEKEIVGADVVVTYDVKKLKLIEIMEGLMFSQYVKENNDKEGKVMISGVIDPAKKSYKGKDTFVTLKFETLKEGKADVRIEYSEGSRNDSNIADRNGNDILTSVENQEIQIVGKGYDNNFFEMIRKFFERLKQNRGKTIRY
jgi:hypothetical protein